MMGPNTPQKSPAGYQITVPLHPDTGKPLDEEGRILMGQMVQDRPAGTTAESAMPQPGELDPVSSDRFMQRMNTENMLKLLDSLDKDQIKEIGL